MSDLTSVRMPSRYTMILILIAIDFILKIGAYTLLDHPIPSDWDLIRLHFTTNKDGISGIGIVGVDIEWIEKEYSFFLGFSLSIVLFSSISFILFRLNLSHQQFLLSIFLTGLVSVMLLNPLGSFIPNLNYSAVEILHICRISGALGLALAIHITRTAIFTRSIVLLFSGSVGNQLGFLYPPYNPIDFLQIRKVGILNLADLYIFTGLFLLIVGIMLTVVHGAYDLSEKLWSYSIRSLEQIHKKKPEE